jgi:hypothetical protein
LVSGSIFASFVAGTCLMHTTIFIKNLHYSGQQPVW